MNRIWDEYRLAVIAAGVVIIAVLSTVFVTPETKQAVIIRTGKVHSIVNIYKPDDPYGQTGAGFWWRIPFVDRVQMVERRVLDLDMDNQQVLTSDQQRLKVNAYAPLDVAAIPDSHIGAASGIGPQNLRQPAYR